MALSGTFYGSWLGSGFQRVFIEWSATQNVTENTSTVFATLRWQNNSTSALSSSVTKNARIIIDGVTYSGTGTVGVAAGTTKTIMTATRTISHSSDGTKSFSLIGAFDLRFTLSGTYYESTLASGVGILDTIPRATTPMVSPSIVTMGNGVTIDTPRASTAFTHTLKYSMINASGTIATGVATSQTWTVPVALANQIPNSTTGTITITCETYNGSTLIGTRTTNFSAVVPHTIVPTVNIAYSGVGLYGGHYVQTKSRVSVTLNATGAYGSTISTRNTSVKSGSNTISTSSSNSFTSGIINYSGTITITTTVTDSRGRTGTALSTFTVVAYSSPRVTAFSAFRANSDGTANPQGSHIRITGSTSISPISNTNTRTTILRYRVAGASTWTNATTNTSTYTPSLAATVSANGNNSFEVQIYTADYYTSAIQTVNVGTAFVLMDFRSTGVGMAIGKVSERDAFEVGMDFYYKGYKIIESGGNANGNYIKFADGTMICYGQVEFTSPTMSQSAGGWWLHTVGSSPLIYFAQEFTTPPAVQVKCNIAEELNSALRNVYEDRFDFRLYSTVNLSSTQRVVHYQAIGRWK